LNSWCRFHVQFWFEGQSGPSEASLDEAGLMLELFQAVPDTADMLHRMT
jgi:hypothetical protein